MGEKRVEGTSSQRYGTDSLRIRRGAAITLAGSAAVLLAGAVLGAPAPARAAVTALMPGSVSPAVQAPSRAGAVPGSRQLTVQVWLKPDVTGASAFASAVATPGSAEFHHYLSPDAYTARFGPSVAQA